MIEIIRQGQPISGVPEETADKILTILHEQETGRICRMIGVPREGVIRAWLGDDGKVMVLPLAYAQSITIDVGFAPVAP